MRINWSAVLQDLKHLASGLKSAKRLRDVLCEVEKMSTWKMIGKCGWCGGNIGYRVYAIWSNGSIVSHSHDLDGAACPNCNANLDTHGVNHQSAHSHEM
jgi:hypothetical protein